MTSPNFTSAALAAARSAGGRGGRAKRGERQGCEQQRDRAGGAKFAGGMDGGDADGGVFIAQQREQGPVETGDADFAEHLRGELALARVDGDEQLVQMRAAGQD